MIITKTPYRVSFFGGGTDYPAWYREHGGAVLAAAINRYCYLSTRYLPPFFEHRHRIVYSRIELTRSIGEIEHPAVREALQFIGVQKGVEVHHDGDLPKQTGLGTSSSFAVGLLHALHALQGSMTTPHQLAQEAIHLERDLCGDQVGSQDQVSAAYGGLNHIQFHADDTFQVNPVIMRPERSQEFMDSLLLFFTGFSRMGSAIASAQVANFPRRGTELTRMAEMVDQGLQILASDTPLAEFGDLLHEGWRLKRSLADAVSTPEIDDLYDRARRAGARGGKLCGAGGGGFLLLYVEPGHQPSVRQALTRCLEVPVEVSPQGSQIIVYQPQPDIRLPGGPPCP